MTLRPLHKLAIEKAVEPWRAKLATQCGKTLAAEHQRDQLMGAMRLIYEYAYVQSPNALARIGEIARDIMQPASVSNR